jgi:hypothetical protein
MNLVRKSIILSENGHIQRDMSDETFWHGVVADAVAVLEPGRVSEKYTYTSMASAKGAAKAPRRSRDQKDQGARIWS